MVGPALVLIALTIGGVAFAGVAFAAAAGDGPAAAPAAAASATASAATSEAASATTPAVAVTAVRLPPGVSKGGKMRGYPVPDERLRKRLPPPPSGNLHLFDPFRQASLKVNIFNRDGSYNVDALESLSHFMRCKRTDTETHMEPRLFAILSHLSITSASDGSR